MSVSQTPAIEHSPSLTTPKVTLAARQQHTPDKPGLGYSLLATPDLPNLTNPTTFESAMFFVSDRSFHAVGFTMTESAAAEGT